VPGHQPGLVYLGFASPEPLYEQEVARVGEPAVRRGRYLQIEDVEAELATMRESMELGRLPWTSFKADWHEVASGQWDEHLIRRFDGYRALPGPALATFSHEPVGDGDPAMFVAAWRHILDVAGRQGGTGPVTLVPVMNGYVWSDWASWSDARIAQYLPPDLLDRWPVVGVDVYHGGPQNQPGQPPNELLKGILAWADRNDVQLLSIGEIGVHDAAAWNGAWSFVERHRDRFMAVAYFNSEVNVEPGRHWRLEGDVLAAFRESLRSPSVARLHVSLQ
jgi:hypothetical protein